MRQEGYVVVRGGISGAGRYISLKLAQCGYNVFANTADAAHNFRGDILISECRELGVQFAYDSGNPADFAIAEKIVADADREIGGNMVCYINNDGVVDGSRLPDLTPGQYKELLDMHFLTLLNCAKTAADHMAKQGGGVFINTVALMPFPDTEADFAFEISLYEAFTRSLAKTYAPMNVRFNTIISAPLAYPPDPQLEPQEAPKEEAHEMHFAPVISNESPDEFLDLLCKVVESPGMTGQVFAPNIRF